VVSFIAFHKRGLGMLSSRFMRALLHYYKVELHHLAPNSISQTAIFAAVCEGYLGMKLHWNLWLHLFKTEHFAKKVAERGVRRAVHAGSCTLQVRAGRGELYIPRSSSRRIAGGTTGGSTCATTTIGCRSFSSGS
jgi:hypothetical protein